MIQPNQFYPDRDNPFDERHLLDVLKIKMIWLSPDQYSRRSNWGRSMRRNTWGSRPGEDTQLRGVSPTRYNGQSNIIKLKWPSILNQYKAIITKYITNAKHTLYDMYIMSHLICHMILNLPYDIIHIDKVWAVSKNGCVLSGVQIIVWHLIK